MHPTLWNMEIKANNILILLLLIILFCMSVKHSSLAKEIIFSPAMFEDDRSECVNSTE